MHACTHTNAHITHIMTGGGTDILTTAETHTQTGRHTSREADALP